MRRLTPATIGTAPAASPVLELAPESPLPRIRGPLIVGASVMGVFVFGFGIWSTFAPLQSAALAPGTVAVESSRKTVQHLEGGIIAQILVKEGDIVTEGQPLVRLDDTKARTAYTSLEGQVWDATARQSRLIAERDSSKTIVFPPFLIEKAKQDSAAAQIIAGQQTIFAARRTLLESKAAAVRERIQQSKEEIRGFTAQDVAAQRRLSLIAQEIGDVQKLLQLGLERKARLLQLQRDQAEIQGNRGQLAAQMARSQQTIAESEVNILTLQHDSSSEVALLLRETEQKVHELQEQLQAAADVLSRVEVRAPEAGTITDLKVHTPGGVVKPGDPLLDLVPKADRMIVKARVRPEDSDVVRVGLPALVRLLPYKQRRTPPVEGTVIYLSADRLVDDHAEAGQPAGQPYYLAKIEINEGALEKVPGVELIPGMPAEVMIRTGKTTVALYALAPILDSFDRAFIEK
jgi:HlyD family secretion protein